MNIQSATKPELLSKCRELGIKKYSNKTKPELIELINAHLSNISNTDEPSYTNIQFTYETPNVVSSGIAQNEFVQFTYETPNVVAATLCSGIAQCSHKYRKIVWCTFSKIRFFSTL